MLAVSDCELAKSDFEFASLAAYQHSTPKAPKKMTVTAPRTCKNQIRMVSGRLCSFLIAAMLCQPGTWEDGYHSRPKRNQAELRQ